MRRFKEILFFVNGASGAEAGLDRAAAIARGSEAVLTLVEVLDGLPRELSMLDPSVNAEALCELAVEGAHPPLQALAARAEQQGVRACTKVLLGKPNLALIEAVERGGYDLLIVNPARKASLKEKILGRAAGQLMRKCPCPVLTLRPAEGERSGRVLAAVAPAIGDESRTRLSAAVLETSAALALAERSELHIVHFWNLSGEALLSRRAGLLRSQMAGLFRGAHHAARVAVEDLLGRADLRDVNFAVHLSKGEPARLIPELADRKRVDLLVMGAPVRTGLAGFLAGNLAEEVFRSVDCPIVTVRACPATAPLASRAA